MEIRESQKGKHKIFYKGFLYRQGNLNKSTINWRCVQIGCYGSLSTPRDYLSPNIIPKELNSHNHLLNESKVTKQQQNKSTIQSVKDEEDDISLETFEIDNDNKILKPINRNTPIENCQLNLTAQERAQCVAWFIENKSDAQTQRNFKTFFGKKPPSSKTIIELYKKFLLTGSVLDQVAGDNDIL